MKGLLIFLGFCMGACLMTSIARVEDQRRYEYGMQLMLEERYEEADVDVYRCHTCGAEWESEEWREE